MFDDEYGFYMNKDLVGDYRFKALGERMGWTRNEAIGAHINILWNSCVCGRKPGEIMPDFEMLCDWGNIRNEERQKYIEALQEVELMEVYNGKIYFFYGLGSVD